MLRGQNSTTLEYHLLPQFPCYDFCFRRLGPNRRTTFPKLVKRFPPQDLPGTPAVETRLSCIPQQLTNPDHPNYPLILTLTSYQPPPLPNSVLTLLVK